MAIKPIGVYGNGYYGGAVNYKYTTEVIPFHVWKIKVTDYAAIIFTGGADISPALYNEKPHVSTYWVEQRDEAEVSLMKECFAHKVPTIGICRGMQLQCALNGGKLIQDVTGHQTSHVVTTPTEKFQVNSIHHQMCWPWSSGAEFRILAHAKNVSTHYHGHMNIEWKPEVEPESILWPDTRAFGVQWHPEGLGTTARASKWFIAQVQNLLGE